MQIVYYSLKGTNDRIARKAAAELGLPCFRIEDVSSRKGFLNFMRSGFESVFARCPQIRITGDYQPDPDHVILLAPVWAGRICSPLRTFCTKYAGKFQSFSLILTRLDPEKTYEAAKTEVEALTGASCRFFASVCAKTVGPAETDDLIEKLKASYRSL